VVKANSTDNTIVVERKEAHAFDARKITILNFSYGYERKES
jgi:hypothetical protein